MRVVGALLAMAMLASAPPALAQSPAPARAGLAAVEEARDFFVQRGFSEVAISTGADGQVVWTAAVPSGSPNRASLMEAVVVGDETASSIGFTALFGSDNGSAPPRRWSLDELDLGLDTWFELIDTFVFGDWPADARGRPQRSEVMQPEYSRGTRGDREFDRAMTIDDAGIHLSAQVKSLGRTDAGGCAAPVPSVSPSAAP